MNFPNSINLYHGTSESFLPNILDKGFQCSNKNYSYFLAAKGIYFVLNRPLIAKSFAEKLPNPVVLSAHLEEISDEKILDLTTDRGLNILWTAYQSLSKIRNEIKKVEHFRNSSDKHFKDMYESIVAKDKDIIDNYLSPSEEWITDGNVFNADSVVLDYLAREYILIIAFVNQGESFQRKFILHEPSYNGVPDYKGMQVKNHLEICVTNTNYIKKESIREIFIDQQLYEPSYYHHIISQ